MKKIMWLIAMIPVIATSVLYQFIPETIPMHYDLAGNTDRWGSRAESFIFPIVILALTLFWHFMIGIYERKLANATTEKEQNGARLNAKVLAIVGIAEAVMFGVMHFVSLYSSCVQASMGSEQATIDIARVSYGLMGILLIFVGNIMPKTRNNSLTGVRTRWSQYNDNT